MKLDSEHGKIGGMLTFVLTVAVLLLTAPTMTDAAGGSGSGRGGPSNGSQGGNDTRNFGDMLVLFRDANGVPVPSAPVQVIDPETGELVDGGLCQQPLAAAGVTVTSTLTGETVCVPGSPDESCLIPVDPYSCSILEGYESYEQPVELSRINVARAPSSVLDRQYEDLRESLEAACCLTLDPAGRLVSSQPDALDADGDGDTTDTVSKTVDSPIQNLVIYREMMTRGYLGTADSPLPLPTPQQQNYGILDVAAKGLGAAADKEGKIDVDVVVYLNQILGLSLQETATQLPKICTSFREEVKGQMQLVEKCFLNYGSYGYQRQQMYSSLPHPAYIPKHAPQQGAFEYLTPYLNASGPNGEPLFLISAGQIGPNVFPDKNNPGAMNHGFTGGNIGGFAQASDDARAVIKFMHDHPVLAGYETEIPCTETGGNP